jgi:hypothetical protein
MCIFRTINSDPRASAHSRIRLSDGSSFRTSIAPGMDFFREIGDSDLSQLIASSVQTNLSRRTWVTSSTIGSEIARTMSPFARHIQQFIGCTTEVHGRDVDIGNGCDAQHLSSALRDSAMRRATSPSVSPRSRDFAKLRRTAPSRAALTASPRGFFGPLFGYGELATKMNDQPKLGPRHHRFASEWLRAQLKLL